MGFRGLQDNNALGRGRFRHFLRPNSRRTSSCGMPSPRASEARARSSAAVVSCVTSLSSTGAEARERDSGSTITSSRLRTAFTFSSGSRSSSVWARWHSCFGLRSNAFSFPRTASANRHRGCTCPLLYLKQVMRLFSKKLNGLSLLFEYRQQTFHRCPQASTRDRVHAYKFHAHAFPRLGIADDGARADFTIRQIKS